MEGSYMARFALITLVVSTTLPFAAALAQTTAQPDVALAAPVEVVPSVSPAAAPPEQITVPVAPVEVAPAPPPTTAPIVSPIVTAPTPVEPAPPVPPAAAQPRVAAKPPKPRAATALTVVNGRAIPPRGPPPGGAETPPTRPPTPQGTLEEPAAPPATTITVMADARTVSHSKPLAPDAKVSLKLPKMKGCLITVAATFEGGSVSD